MKTNRRICENCRTGKEAYELDNRLPMCPYIGNWKNNKCSFYVPLEPIEPTERKKDSLLIKILKHLNLA